MPTSKKGPDDKGAPDETAATEQRTAPEDQPRPGPMPTEGDETREVGKRASADVKSAKKDTDEAGYDTQRSKAPSESPTKRSGITDDSKG